MDERLENIAPHHRNAAVTWGLPGANYDFVSFAISDALAHATQRLAPMERERVLDIATGTGWTARNVARFGAEVTGLDIAGDLLAAARELSRHVEPPITFVQGDAERLPFEDATFDKVISTFGVMFAADQQKAADEIARVTKPGGRVVIAAWSPGGAVEAFFALVARHAKTPPPELSPMNWGDPGKLQAMLGGAFDLKFEHGWNNSYDDGVEDLRHGYEAAFGPLQAVMGRLDEQGKEAFRRDIDAYHEPYLTDAGLLHVKREYLLTIGHRR